MNKAIARESLEKIVDVPDSRLPPGNVQPWEFVARTHRKLLKRVRRKEPITVNLLL